MRDLAERANTTSSTINKLEKGRTRLNTDWLEKLSKAFDVTPDQIVSFTPLDIKVISDDVVAYQEKIQEFMLSDAQLPYLAKTNVLDEIGIEPGKILIVDMSPDEIKHLKSGDIVIVEYNQGTKATTLLRQHIKPNLLITNSRTNNAPIINLQTEDARIMGVVIASHQRFRGNLNRSEGAKTSSRPK